MTSAARSIGSLAVEYPIAECNLLLCRARGWCQCRALTASVCVHSLRRKF